MFMQNRMVLLTADEVDLYYFMCPQPRQILIALVLQGRQPINANFHDTIRVCWIRSK